MQPAPLADLFVDASATNCATGAGTSGDPVCSIGAAIGLAAPGDTIRIAPGTYVENLSIGFDLDLIGTSGASVTTVDGGGSGTVVTIAAAVTVAIDGLTIQNGNATAAAGIRLDGNLTLSNSTIRDNSASGYGRGGGIGTGTTGTSLIIDNCLIVNNTNWGDGGGIGMDGGVCVITDSTISNNSANQFGGGIYFRGPDPDVNQLTVTNSTFTENSAGDFGGAIEILVSSLVLSGSTLSNNTAGEGGAIESFGGKITASNSTISGNNGVLYGGGILIWGGAGHRLENLTITDNVTNRLGGGIRNTTGALIETRNVIIAGNTASNASAADGHDVSGVLTSLGHNLIGDGGMGFTDGIMGDIVGTFSAPIDPLLGPLQDNGGPTETRQLLAGSPALDAGDPLEFESFDQRGGLRPAGVGSDIGAYEEQEYPQGSFCFGDGSGTACPCNNNSLAGYPGGCGNSAGNGAYLAASGIPSVAADTLNFDLVSATPVSFALLASADNQLPQSGGCIGCGQQSFDGLRCVEGGLLRHGTRAISAEGETANGWGPPGGPAGGLIAANGFSAGQTRHFFAVYRDDLMQVCQSGQNSSNGVTVTFQP